MSHSAEFEARLGFPLDQFQRDAISAIDNNHSVLVAAPTGSGKTVVAEYAIERSLNEGSRAFYTTPIKALSNQKYHDFCALYGTDQVGLLTGDNSINGSAPIVVMTTEVLRNMIYERSSDLDYLSWVILDEVHYLQDEYRGPVWEEVIIHAPAPIKLVCLSATVSNASELADWITTLRGPTDVIVETTRPVRLENHYLVGDRAAGYLRLADLLVDGKPNPRGKRFDVGFRPSGGSDERRWYTPRRAEVIELLHERNLLPAITFIFSRAACDDAVRACMAYGLRLTKPAERSIIREVAARHASVLTEADRMLLGYDRFVAALEEGYAAHHAGMVPPFKEAVEELFAAGLVKAVFATETLALGVNMPARTVVIEKLTKFTGERHERLTPGQYTQLTGRAGRRGKDSLGHAVVLWSPYISFDETAALALSRSFELTSAFRPTYNMAANLIRRYNANEAHAVIENSFAQYRLNRRVVETAQEIQRLKRRRDALHDKITCEKGDIAAYMAEFTKSAAPSPLPNRKEVARALRSVKPGTILQIEGGKSGGPAVVLSVSERRGGAVKLRLVSQAPRIITLSDTNFNHVPERRGSIELPTPFAPNQRKFINEVRRRLREARLSAPKRHRNSKRPRRLGETGHPLENCDDFARHVEAFRQSERLDARIKRLERKRSNSSGGLAQQFDGLLELLEDWDYLQDWHLTEAGELLARIYSEVDLLAAEALHQGLLDGLDPATLAGVVSAFTYEHRSPKAAPNPWFPPGPMRERVTQIEAVAHSLNRAEMAAKLPVTRPPDAGFCAIAHAWASGNYLQDVLAEEMLSGGDFVRNIKQLIDLLRQIGGLAPDPVTASNARAAANLLLRDVVEASSKVHVGANRDDPQG